MEPKRHRTDESLYLTVHNLPDMDKFLEVKLECCFMYLMFIFNVVCTFHSKYGVLQLSVSSAIDKARRRNGIAQDIPSAVIRCFDYDRVKGTAVAEVTILYIITMHSKSSHVRLHWSELFASFVHVAVPKFRDCFCNVTKGQANFISS